MSLIYFKDQMCKMYEPESMSEELSHKEGADYAFNSFQNIRNGKKFDCTKFSSKFY